MMNVPQYFIMVMRIDEIIQVQELVARDWSLRLDIVQSAYQIQGLPLQKRAYFLQAVGTIASNCIAEYECLEVIHLPACHCGREHIKAIGHRVRSTHITSYVTLLSIL